MEHILLKIDEIVAQKWDTLSLEQQEQLTRQFEELVLQLLTNNERIANEPLHSYRKNVKGIQTMQKEEKPTCESKSKTERRQRIKVLTSPLLVDLSKFKFDRNEANDYGS